MRTLMAALLLAVDEPNGRRYPGWDSVVRRALQVTRRMEPRPVRAEFDALRDVTIGEITTGEVPERPGPPEMREVGDATPAERVPTVL